MFATSTTDRFRFLKDLRILEAQNSSLPLAENHASQLKIMRILSHSTHLEKVSLWDVEGLLDNFPDAISQLVNLSMLREIECSNSRSLVGWLGQLRAPLTELSFSLDDNDPPVRFLGNISHFRDTLRTLSVGYPFFDAIDAGTQFPHVGKLTIQFIYPSTPSSCYSASTIFRLFPNLKSLVFPADSYDSDDLESFQTEIEGWHDEHVVEAVRDGVEGKALEEFNGCVDDLYAGAYICRIQRLFVHCLDHINSQWLLPLLIHIRPSILILEFWRCESGPATIGILSSILQELSTCNSLQSLFLVYSFEGTESGVARSIMEMLPETLQLAAITQLNISYKLTYEDSDNIEFLENVVNWEEAVIQIILAVPSILFVEFESWQGRSRLFRIPKNLVTLARQKFEDEPAVISYIRSKIRSSAL